MAGLERLTDEITAVLASQVKAYNLPAVTASFGLEAGEESEAFSSKRTYVAKRLAGWSKEQLVELARKVQESYPDDSLQCMIEEFDPTQPFCISSITRQHVYSCLSLLPSIEGKLGVVEFMEKMWPIKEMAASGLDPRCRTAYDEIDQHMIRNDDFTTPEMIEHLGLAGMSNKKLVELLEWAVHPLVRVDSQQNEFVDAINAHLRQDGLALVATDQISGYPVFRVLTVSGGVSGTVKNLIFASNGPKPEIVFTDAINNDIKIVRHEEHCLVYDLPLTKGGLLWQKLVEWWAAKAETEANEDIERALYCRLRESLASPPEKLLFHTYFKHFRPAFGDHLPALIPQVYLHYDPYTLAQLRGNRRVARQRMDFLLLFSSYERVVVEVDGKQHYSENEHPSPTRYGEMVKADRDLRLSGYEIYRFSGSELAEGHGETVVVEFFTSLFQKHNVYRKTQALPSNDETSSA